MKFTKHNWEMWNTVTFGTTREKQKHIFWTSNQRQRTMTPCTFYACSSLGIEIRSKKKKTLIFHYIWVKHLFSSSEMCLCVLSRDTRRSCGLYYYFFLLTSFIPIQNPVSNIHVIHLRLIFIFFSCSFCSFYMRIDFEYCWNEKRETIKLVSRVIFLPNMRI